MYSWRELNARLNDLGERELLDLLDAELKGPKRTTVLVRLHQRYTMVRAGRERSEMLRKVGTTPSDARCSA
jgi:hypothetical protein